MENVYVYGRINENGRKDICFDSEAGSYAVPESALLREGNLNTLRFIAPVIRGKGIVYEMPPVKLPVTARTEDSFCRSLTKFETRKIMPKIFLAKRIMSNGKLSPGVVLEKKLGEGFIDTKKVEICGNSHYNVLAKGNDIVLYDATADVAITPGKVYSIGGN